ncbi:hypothetical protein MA16_Dca024091 [Dendrobium catenatum]|uniref:Uncharacterized protein n=1 Tax=Dendrobium catenatum TaxID=906689 RepID=A0A2I0VT87_9ASPA|nr:hypothetical protein MA16_Dca024091 [Dendrobium catenatum]
MKRIGSSEMKPKKNWVDLYVMFQDRWNNRWTNSSPVPHPCGCHVLEEMEIDLEEKWGLKRNTNSVLLKEENKQIHFSGRVVQRGFALCHSRKGDRRDDNIKTAQKKADEDNRCNKPKKPIEIIGKEKNLAAESLVNVSHKSRPLLDSRINMNSIGVGSTWSNSNLGLKIPGETVLVADVSMKSNSSDLTQEVDKVAVLEKDHLCEVGELNEGNIVDNQPVVTKLPSSNNEVENSDKLRNSIVVKVFGENVPFHVCLFSFSLLCGPSIFPAWLPVPVLLAAVPVPLAACPDSPGHPFLPPWLLFSIFCVAVRLLFLE